MNVTARLSHGAPASRRLAARIQEDTMGLENTSPDIVDTHLIVVVDGLPAGVTLVGAEGVTRDGKPYLRVYLEGGMLAPGASMPLTLRFHHGRRGGVTGYGLTFLSGQGDPRAFRSDGTTG
jgi:hypothetical protein